MSGARKFLPHYTASDYCSWQGDWELWQGIPVSMTPSPFGEHQRVAKNLVYELERQIRDQPNCQGLVLYETDWIVSDDTVVRPDVLVLCDETPKQHVLQTPVLTAEILSESTEIRDRKAKRELYDECGVGVYLLVDPASQTLEAFTRQLSNLWTHQQVDDAIRFRLCEHCELTISRRSLFSP